ncbi:MAG: hypothetical protein IJC39_01635 [Firmicutes bacterium]|nr:hypothetical protein [Bacillota bacterium]
MDKYDVEVKDMREYLTTFYASEGFVELEESIAQKTDKEIRDLFYELADYMGFE